MKRKDKQLFLLLIITAILVFLIFTIIILTNLFESNFIPLTSPQTTTPANFKLAFIADQGLTENSRAVLQLIKSEGAELVLHQGDFDYENNPEKWDEQISSILGEDFPYFASIGNHDIESWQGYQKRLQQRLSKISEAQCTGDLGIKSACYYKGVFFILSGAGTRDSNHDEYIKTALANTNATWRICSWHKNQRLMQVGNKKDEVGWQAYEECRKGGAIIATGHDHAYARTHLLSNFENQEITSSSNSLILEKGENGKTFAFVSGLGGLNIYNQDNELATKPWWAVVYTAQQNATYGALFCTFNKNNLENLANCYFKNINNEIIDSFEIISNIQ